MLPYLERGELVPKQEIGNSRSLGWLEKLDQFDQQAHATFRSLYEKLERSKMLPRGFTKEVGSAREDNPYIWTSLSFNPMPDELRQAPQDLRMLFNDLGITDADKAEVEISYKTRKSNDGKPGEYDSHFFFSIKPQEVTENRLGISMATGERAYVFDNRSNSRYNNRHRYPSEKEEALNSLYGQGNSEKKLSSWPINTVVLTSVAQWVGGLLEPTQRKKVGSSDIDFGWIDVAKRGDAEATRKTKENLSNLFDLADGEIEGVNISGEQSENPELSIEVRPEDYSLLPEAVECLLVDLGINKPESMEVIANRGWGATLQLQPNALSKTELGIAFGINPSAPHKILAPKRVHYYPGRDFAEGHFDFGRKVQEGYNAMPVALKVYILNGVLKWGQEIVERRKV